MTLAQKSDRILAQTRGLSGATPNATQLIEELRSALEENRREVERLTTERVTEARRELCAARRELCRNEAIIRLQRHRVHRDSEDVAGLAKEIAVERGWDCFKEKTDA